MAGVVPSNQACAWVPALPQPTLGNGGVYSVTMSTHIAASPATCLQVTLEAANYPKWNKFVREVVINKAAPSSSLRDLDPALGFLAGTGTQADKMLLPGTETTFKAYVDQNSDSVNNTHLVVTELKEFEHEGRKGFRVAWAQKGRSWFQDVERTQDFVEAADGGTEYYSNETFYGPMAYVIKAVVGNKLLKALDLWMSGLKSEAEGQ